MLTEVLVWRPRREVLSVDVFLNIVWCEQKFTCCCAGNHIAAICLLKCECCCGMQFSWAGQEWCEPYTSSFDSMYTGEFATKIFRKIEWFTVYIFSNQKNAAAKAHLKQKCGPFFGRSWVSPASVHSNRCSLKAPAPPNSWHWQFLGLTITPSAKAVDNLSWATVIDISKGPILGKRTADWMQVICKQNLVKGRCFRRFCTKCTRATIKCYFPSLICKIKWHGFMLNSCDTGNTKLYVTYIT